MRDGHPQILPPAFSDFSVLKGGVGAEAVTRFTVDPEGSHSRLRVETPWNGTRGPAGLIDRFVAPRLFRKLYAEELDLIERWARNRATAS